MVGSIGPDGESIPPFLTAQGVGNSGVRVPDSIEVKLLFLVNSLYGQAYNTLPLSSAFILFFLVLHCTGPTPVERENYPPVYIIKP